jgi:two-component system, OmpR family, sensor kinase
MQVPFPRHDSFVILCVAASAKAGARRVDDVAPLRPKSIPPGSGGTKVHATQTALCASWATGRAPTKARPRMTMARPGSPRHAAQRPHVPRGSGPEHVTPLDAMLDRLQAVVRGQHDLVRHTTHELRDALTIIGGHVELMGDDPEERRQMVGLVLDEVGHMARIVHELQLLTDAPDPDFLHLERLELAPLIRSLVEEASYLAPRRWQLDSVAPTSLVADRLRLREAVLDLAHNALQTTREDDTVAIGASGDDDTVRIWVRDTGRGIARSDQAGIFERFVRRSRGPRGTGLGLAVVKAITEAHGGQVELQSRVGTGSTLTIALSRRLEREAAEREAS